MTTVTVNTYTHSVTYVTDNILRSFKDIVRLSGLNPSNFASDWTTYEKAMKIWLQAGDLKCVILEIYDPRTGDLVHRWDMDIAYGYGSGDTGVFWADPDQIRYAMKKAGLPPSSADYRLVLDNKPGHQDIDGWTTTTLRSTEAFRRHSLGTTIEHNGLGSNAAYWGRT